MRVHFLRDVFIAIDCCSSFLVSWKGPLNGIASGLTVTISFFIQQGKAGENEEESEITRCSVTALVLGVFPVLYFFTFLYYTDSGSVFFVLLTYYLSLRGNHFAAALAGSASIFLRQTNVIWVIFTAGVTALRTIHKSMDKTALGDSPGFLGELKAYCIMFCKHFFELFKCLWSYGLVVVGFAGFVVWNGGIVVGDKSQHKACLNFPQVFYVILYSRI